VGNLLVHRALPPVGRVEQGARVADAHMAGRPAEFAQPSRLVPLTFEADRVLTY
jgi:hypothetical protein